MNTVVAGEERTCRRGDFKALALVLTFFNPRYTLPVWLCGELLEGLTSLLDAAFNCRYRYLY
jgi:hypothetical protein